MSEKNVSTEYRDDMRYPVRVFSTGQTEMLAPEGVSYLHIDDLEALYELVMGKKPVPPAAYQARPGARKRGSTPTD
jgi:hypothetical protein